MCTVRSLDLGRDISDWIQDAADLVRHGPLVVRELSQVVVVRPEVLVDGRLQAEQPIHHIPFRGPPIP